MKKYLFSIFTRGFVAGTGLLVFLVSASLFGASGRGIISYGTSVYTFFGLIFCMNLGRSFLTETVQSEERKKEFVSRYMTMNILVIFLGCISSFLFWYFSDSAKEILDFKIMCAMMVSSIFYVWSVNSTAIFAAFQDTHTQEKIILFTRFVLCILLGLFYFLKIYKIAYFMGFYSLIIGGGSLAEMVYLYRKHNIKLATISLVSFKQTLKISFWPHIDYLAFNLFPLILILIAGKFMIKEDIGRINLAMQFINVIFLLSIVANIRISSYVSTVGFAARKSIIFKLFIFTLFSSLFFAGIIYFGINYLIELKHFSSFFGADRLFLIGALAIPGFVLYQFLNPIWMEKNKIHNSTLINCFAVAIVGSLSWFGLQNSDPSSAMLHFSYFYIFVFFGQILLALKAKIFRVNQ